MKKNRKVLNIILNLVFLISSFYILPVVYAQEPSTITNNDGIKLTKTATRVNDLLNTWTIDLKLEFTPKIKSQDIVLVMDRSGSMEGDRLKNAKKAANQFVDIILDDSEFAHENRIALINYSVGAKVDNNFTTDKASLKSNIDALTATGVTFTQLGLYEARKLLEGSTADEKIIVLLTDGAPTFAFD